MTAAPPSAPLRLGPDEVSAELLAGVYHYSMRLVYQGLYLPNGELEGEVTALALGPPNDLYVAAGAQVYHIERPR